MAQYYVYMNRPQARRRHITLLYTEAPFEQAATQDMTRHCFAKKNHASLGVAQFYKGCGPQGTRAARV
jgi:hypothetical protein